MDSSLSDNGQLSDADLLQRMARRDNEAWRKFHARHAVYVYTAIKGICGGLIAAQDIEDLVAETMIRAYERAHQFDANGMTDHEALRRLVRGWLGAIAKNLWKSWLRRSSSHESSIDFHELNAWPTKPTQDCLDSIITKFARQAIEALDPREQEVIRLTFQWYDPTKAHQRIPPEVIEDLASHLGITSEHIRQLRARAIKRIRDYLDRFFIPY
jgi:RNA polymerase sigma factor (sigma-70 family)